MWFRRTETDQEGRPVLHITAPLKLPLRILLSNPLEPTKDLHGEGGRIGIYSAAVLRADPNAVLSAPPLLWCQGRVEPGTTRRGRGYMSGDTIPKVQDRDRCLTTSRFEA